MMNSIKALVCHPGRQYSHHLAMTLASHGMLARYVTGVPAHAEAIPPWQRPLLRKLLSAYSLDIDPGLVRHVFVAPIVRRIARRIGSSAVSTDWGHRGDAWFDRLAARDVRHLKPDLVICYENAALETFREARRLGATTILDAASFHHFWQDRHYDPVETETVHKRICRRKDEEIALADHVLTVSALARESYVAAGVPAAKVTSLRLGADLAAFEPRTVPRVPGPPRFVFVGHVGRRKGMDVLLSAMEQLQADGVVPVITTIGKPEPGFTLPERSGVRDLGWMPASELAKELVRHDVLVLPSRHDSFGMVVAEAMACGLPAIVSDNVGAKELVTPGVNGSVVVTGDPKSLADAMRWFVDNLSRLPQMGESARIAAGACDWSVYKQRAVELLTLIAADAAG